MTTLPYDPHRRYTVAEFAALPEDNSALYELAEGIIVVSPRALPVPAKVVLNLSIQIEPQLPDHLDVLTEIDVDLQLTLATVRIPDVVITTTDVYGQNASPKRLRYAWQ